MALTNAQMLLGTAPAAPSDTGYQIPRSLRFVMGDSTRLYSTFLADGDLRTGTHSFWFKKVDPTQAPNVGIVSSKVDSDTFFDLHWENTAQFAMFNMHTYPSNADGYSTIPQFRDPGGWSHYCVVWDTRDTTAISRFRMFINGKEHARTGLSNWEPGLNDEGYWGRANIHEIGRLDLSGWNYMNGYMADYRYIDGWKPTITNGYISDLGELDADTGIWVPKAFTMPQNPNAKTTFSSTNFVATISGWASSGGTIDKLFSGIPDPGNWTQSATTSSTSSSATWDLGSTGRINNVTSMRIQIYLSSNQASASNAVKINGTDVTATCLAPGHSAFNWIDLADHEFTYLQSIYLANNYIYISAIEINGIMLVDGVQNNSFHLRYANDTHNNTLGFSAAQANISSPTILDDMGNVNEDPNSDHIQIAVPMYKSALYVKDVSADIKGSGTNKTVSNNGNGGNAYAAAVTTTFLSAFYDGSAKSDGTANAVIASANYTKHGSSDDWTMEWWGYYPSSGMPAHCRIMNIGADSGAGGLNCVIYSAGELYINTANGADYLVGSSYGGGSNYITDTDMIDKWCHFAISRNSGTIKAFINGRIRAVRSSDTSAATADMNIGGTGTLCAHYIQDFRYYVGVGKYGGNSFIPPKRNDWQVSGFAATAGAENIPLSTASGGKPFLKTTDNYGSVLGSGYESDANASSLMLAIPGNGSTITDQHAGVNTSSTNRTITAAGDPATSSSTQKFYSEKSIYFDGNDSFTVPASADFNFGTGDWTIEMWLNFDTINKSQCLVDYTDNSSATGGNGQLYWSSSSGMQWYSESTSYAVMNKGNFFANNWHHICYVKKSGTLYGFLDGVQRANQSHSINARNSTGNFRIGLQGTTWLEGYLQDIRVYKGVAKYDPASSNGERSFSVPSKPTITTMVTIDSTKDSPVNAAASGDSGNGGEISGNYATWNPLWNNDFSYSQGNLKVDTETSNGHCRSTLGMISGQKFYAEFTWVSGSSGMLFGVVAEAQSRDHNIGQGTNGWGYYSAGSFQTNSSDSGSPASYSHNDVIGVALDLSAGGTNNGVVTFYKNGASQGAAFSNLDCTKTYFFACNDGSSSGTGTSWGNFGQKIFLYPVSGYKCLCSSNLASKDQTIKKASDYFDALIFTGTGNNTTYTETRLGFQPDLLWFKKRNGTSNHAVFDVVRGTSNAIRTNNDDSQSAYGNAVVTPTGTGFTITGSNVGDLNGGSDNMAGWFWDAGDTGQANTDGSINIASGNQYVNQTSGFSISKYEGTKSLDTIGHGLGIKPELIICKNLDRDDGYWFVYHKGLGATKVLELNTNNTPYTSADFWNDTEPTSSVFTVNSKNDNNGSGDDHVAYCWTSVIGYSKIDTYVGDNTTQHFIYTGFKPAFVLIKDTGAANNWYIYDDQRERVLNPHTKPLFPDGNYAEQGDGRPVDLNANGFTLRNASWINTSGNTHVYAAFANSPLSLSNAH